MEIVSLIASFGGIVWTIVAFVVALSVIVAIHEYGHYIVGRWSGIHADVFSIGFGPVLWSRNDKRGTKWQIAALPFGGYVKFAGDANAASGKDEEAMEEVASDPVALRRTMHGAPLWARTATVLAGPVFNFVLSILVFGAIAFSNGEVRDPLTVGEIHPLPVEERGLQTGDVLLAVNGLPVPSREDPNYGDMLDEIAQEERLTFTVERDGITRDVSDAYLMPPIVLGLSAQSAAIKAGLEVGDVITAIDGDPVFAFDQLKQVVESSDGRTLQLDIWRAGETSTVELTPKRRDEPQDDGGFVTQWRIGIAGGMMFEAATETPGVGTALMSGVNRTGEIISGSLSGLWHMITGAISTCNLSGPVGIAEVSGQMASQGALNFIFFIAVLSTAVGLLNLFPIPALDGGHLMFYAYEAVTGRPPSDAVLKGLMIFGFGMVLTLMLFALANDIFCP